jgi:hypothetical protein
MPKRIRDPIKAREYQKNYKASPAYERAKLKRRKNYSKDQRKHEALRDAYGISLDQYNEIRKAQNDCCLICERHVLKIPNQVLCVDHDHNTEEIRGLLCFDCNTGLGKFKDNTMILEKALEYLRNRNASRG